MAAIFAFTCRCCGEVHEGSPSFAYNEPAPYASLSEEQKKTIAKIDSDLCVIQGAERTDYFARAVLEVPIIGAAEPFTWGVWTSLSEKSFNRYVETYDHPVVGENFFGWVCNRVPFYPVPAATFAADVYVQPGGTRPKLVLRDVRNEGHPLIIDQREGISIARAQEIAEQVMHRG